MNKHKKGWFNTVHLSLLNINAEHNQSSATFLANEPAYFIRQAMVSICDLHRRGSSFDGKFTSKDIMVVNERMLVFSNNLQVVSFTKETCINDYNKFREILLDIFFDGHQIIVPMYFDNLLDYLRDCPGGELSKSESLIRFVTNHPAISNYTDRINQCTLSDNLINRLHGNEGSELRDILRASQIWKEDVEHIPSMDKVYTFGSYVDSFKVLHVNPKYTADYLGCIHFAKNYFSHADYQLMLEEIDAAFAVNFKNFLPKFLYLVAHDYMNSSNDKDMLKLLGNQSAEPFTWNK